MPSYSQVYSQPLILYTPSTPNTSFLVPSGFTAVVRQISGYQNIGGWTLETIIAGAGAPDGVTISFLGQAGALNYAAEEGRWAVPEDYYIEINFSELGSTFSCYVGGYLLRNTLS